jgi:hypothetical protein
MHLNLTTMQSNYIDSFKNKIEIMKIYIKMEGISITYQSL